MIKRKIGLALLVPMICGLTDAALAAEARRSFVLVPKVTAYPDNGVDLYQLPSVEARLLENVNGKPQNVILPNNIGNWLLEIFGPAKTSSSVVTSVQLDGTLVVEAQPNVGPENEAYPAYVSERTIACLQAIDDAGEANEFANFLVDPDGGATTPSEFSMIIETYKPTAERMLARFVSDRCAQARNAFVPNAIQKARLDVAARVLFLGDTVMSFTVSDLLVAAGVFQNFYFGRTGVSAIRTTLLLKEVLLKRMDLLSRNVSSIDQPFTNFFKFYNYHLMLSPPAIGSADLEQIYFACIDEDTMRDPFNLQDCYDSGRIRFHSLSLENTLRYFVEDVQP